MAATSLFQAPPGLTFMQISMHIELLSFQLHRKRLKIVIYFQFPRNEIIIGIDTVCRPRTCAGKIMQFANCRWRAANTPDRSVPDLINVVVALARLD